MTVLNTNSHLYRSITMMAKLLLYLVGPKIDPFDFSKNLEDGMRAVAVCAVISGDSPIDIK